MATVNRATLLGKLHKVLKKHYAPQPAPPSAPLLEQMLFACCLENAHYAPASAAFRALSATFFDWNEVRVTTAKELAEVMSALPEPEAAATSLKSVLQSVFETTYSFELDAIRKLGLGQAVKRLEKIDGVSPFVVSYVVQHSLGGHAIPVDRGTLEVFAILGIVTETEYQKKIVPGLERAIPKNKGIEFGSLVHQLGADLILNPYSTNLHKVLVEANPEAKSRLPRRMSKKAAAASQQAKVQAKATKDEAAASRSTAKKKSAPADHQPPRSMPAGRKAPADKAAEKRKSPEKSTTASRAKASAGKKKNLVRSGAARRKPR